MLHLSLLSDSMVEPVEEMSRAEKFTSDVIGGMDYRENVWPYSGCVPTILIFHLPFLLAIGHLLNG